MMCEWLGAQHSDERLTRMGKTIETAVGLTLVVADLESQNFSLIEIWTGGMVRKFDEVTP